MGGRLRNLTVDKVDKSVAKSRSRVLPPPPPSRATKEDLENTLRSLPMVRINEPGGVLVERVLKSTYVGSGEKRELATRVRIELLGIGQTLSPESDKIPLRTDRLRKMG